MATKPALASFLWASDTNYATGPAPLIGTVTKITPPVAESDEGWKADQAPPAQWENFVKNLVTQWTEWVRLGVNVNDEDAHIVESDSLGMINPARATIGGQTTAAPSLTVTASTNDNVASDQILVDRTLINAAGVHVTTQRVNADAYNGAGLVVEKNAGSFGYGAKFQGTAGPAALFGHAADTVNDAAGATFEPRTTIPGGPVASLAGDMIYFSPKGAHGHPNSFGFYAFWQSRGGRLVRAYAEDLAETGPITAGGTPVAKATASIATPQILDTGMNVHIRATCTVGQNNTVVGACRVGLRDVTAGVDIVVPRTIRTFQSTSDSSEKEVIVAADYDIPADGNRDFAITYVSDGNGANEMYIANATIEVFGPYLNIAAIP